MSQTVTDTAFAIASIRADEAERPVGERLFDDPYARLFAAAAGPEAIEGTARFRSLPFFCDGVRLRTRYLDDVTRAALADGVAQVVLLGVGFDARSLRMPELRAEGVRVFEVDMPAQLAARRAILDAEGVAPSPSTASVACDFEAAAMDDGLAADLAASGYRPEAPALFVWEGVLAYLSRASADRTFAFIARHAAPGSQVAFDFGAFSFEPEGAAERTRALGFRACDEVGLDAIWRRHLAGEPHENAWVARVGVARV